MERTLSIHSIIAGAPVAGSGEEISAVAAFDGAPLEPAYRATSPEEFERAASAAADAFDAYRATDHETRAAFLERIADAIEARGAEITERGVVETGLPAARLENERGRTTGQLRLFAAVLREGSWAVRASTAHCPTVRPRRGRTSAAASCPSARSPSSAPATSRSRSRPPAATPRRRSPPGAPSS